MSIFNKSENMIPKDFPSKLVLKVDTSELDEALAKAERLVELLEKANDLTNGAAPMVEVTIQ